MPNLSGDHMLSFDAGDGGKMSVVTGTAPSSARRPLFDPVGLPGLAHWYPVYPLHELVFARMLKNLARTARRQDH
jgi:hypothetical protein